MSRPILKIERDSYDKALDTLCIITCIIMVVLPAFYFNQISEVIPTHFNIEGKADGFGPKETLLLMPVLGVIIYLILSYIIPKPHLFNYPKKITEENAAVEYRKAQKMMRITNLSSLAIFTIITWTIIQAGLNKNFGMSSWLMILIFILPFIGVIWYFSKNK